jgi:hypothetical protein
MVAASGRILPGLSVLGVQRLRASRTNMGHLCLGSLSTGACELMELCGCCPLVPESLDTLPRCVDTGSTAVSLLRALKHSDSVRGQKLKGFHDRVCLDAVPAGAKLAADRSEIEPAALFERVLCLHVQDVDKRVLKLTPDLLRLPVPTQGIPACRCMQGRIDEDL